MVGVRGLGVVGDQEVKGVTTDFHYGTLCCVHGYFLLFDLQGEILSSMKLAASSIRHSGKDQSK